MTFLKRFEIRKFFNKHRLWVHIRARTDNTLHHSVGAVEKSDILLQILLKKQLKAVMVIFHVLFQSYRCSSQFENQQSQRDVNH